jgi:hypothetical protein
MSPRVEVVEIFVVARVECQGGPSLVAAAFDNSDANLPWKPWFADRMSAGTAKFAVYAYRHRNLVCDSESIQRKTVGDWHGLGPQISEDLQQLREVLPDDQLEHETDWRRIILYYVETGTSALIRRVFGNPFQRRNSRMDFQVTLLGMSTSGPYQVTCGPIPLMLVTSGVLFWLTLRLGDVES